MSPRRALPLPLPFFRASATTGLVPVERCLGFRAKSASHTPSSPPANWRKGRKGKGVELRRFGKNSLPPSRARWRASPYSRFVAEGGARKKATQETQATKGTAGFGEPEPVRLGEPESWNRSPNPTHLPACPFVHRRWSAERLRERICASPCSSVWFRGSAGLAFRASLLS